MPKKKICLSDPEPSTIYRIDTKKAHIVYRNEAGKRVPGVTTVLGIQAKPYLIPWANKLGLEGIDSTKFVDDTAQTGTITHALCECHVKGMKLDISNLSPEQLDNAETSFLLFVTWWDNEGFTLVDSELAIVSEMWQCGGTLDILARDREGRLCLIDIKTSKAIYKEHRVQTSAYAEFWEEQNEGSIERVIICRPGKNKNGDFGDFEVREVFDRPACVEHFSSLRKAYETDKLVKQ